MATRVALKASAARPDLTSVLEDKGYRVTGPRLNIIRLLGKKNEGFSAEEINYALPGVGRATVFRTLKLLLGANVICKLTTRDGGVKYSLARVEHHHHTVCVKCGTVGDFRDVTIERLLRTLGDEIQGQIVGHRIEVDVVCPSCQKASRN
ncbi:MAG: transcriptional repressor [SAR202 cluster bacterium]|nr:transcriptional repressor [SAR202 cluster bacterium]